MDKDQPIHLDLPAGGTADAAPADLSDIEAINNLDTARMALRWALERLHSLQMLKEESERKAAAATADRRQAEEDRKDIQRVMVLRNQEDSQRAAYYAKLEAYLSQHFAGKLDLPALIKRESHTAELEALLQERQLHLEKEYSARRERLEAEFGRAKFQAEQAAEEQVAHAKASVLESRQNLERGFAVKLAELTDQEVRLKAENEALARRQAQFEAFSREQRARLELDIKAFHDSVEDQMKFRVDSAELFLSTRHDAAASTWDREKKVLLGEIDDLREKSLSYLPRLAELEKMLVMTEEAAGRTKAEAEVQARRLQGEIHTLQAERATLAEEVDRLRHQREADLGRLFDLERKAVQADEDRDSLGATLLQEKALARQAQEEMARRVGELQAEMARRDSLIEQQRREYMEAAAKRISDVDTLEVLLIGRFQDLEDEIHQRDQAWKEREEVLRTRDRDWHQRLSGWQAQLQLKSQQLEELKGQMLETIQSYKAKISRSENPAA